MKNILQNKYINKYSVAFILGFVSALIFAPTYFFFLAFIAFSGLFIILNNCQSKKESFWVGWFFGFGHFILGLYWICISLLVEADKFAWLIPFALTLIPAACAVYIGLTTLITNIIANLLALDKQRKLLLLSVIWLFFEYLRSILFSGFPWNLLGYSLGFSEEFIQIASIVGIYGLSLMAVIIFTFPALFFDFVNQKIKFKINKANLSVFSLIIIFVFSIWIYGKNRLENAQIEVIDNGNLRLVQSNIIQGDKWDPELRYNSFMKNIRLSHKKGFKEMDYIIWSESAVPYIISKDSEPLLRELSKAVPEGGFLVTGALRAEFLDSNKNTFDKVWNSIFIIDKNSKVNAYYDKNHLVPFGEYVPFAKFLPFISKITHGSTGFSTGKGIETIKPADNFPKFSPLICYEIIFSNKVIDKSNPPQFLVNVTNDAWFGNSSGPYQHFDMAKMRAVEYGIPIARVANTGITALIDPYGRVVDKIALNYEGILDVKLMKNLPITIYAKYGTNLLLLTLYIILMIIIIRRVSK